MRLACLVVVVGCWGGIDEPTPTIESRVQLFEFPQPYQPPVDVLVAVDPTIAHTTLDPALRVIATATDHYQDLHVAIVDSCSGNAGFISDAIRADGSHAGNFLGDRGDALVRLATFDTCAGPQQPLDAVIRTIDLLEGFRRPVPLVVVVLAAHDDQSEIASATFVTELEMADPDVAFFVLGTDLPRLASIAIFGVPTVPQPLDTPEVLGEVGWNIKYGLGATCLPDGVDATTCEFVDRYPDGTFARVVRCDATASQRPCFRVIDDDVGNCDSFGMRGLGLVRFIYPPQGTFTHGECVVTD